MTSRRNFMIAVSSFAAAAILPTLPAMANCSSVDVPDGWGDGGPVTNVDGVGVAEGNMVVFIVVVLGVFVLLYTKAFEVGVGAAGGNAFEIDDDSYRNYEPKPR